MGVKYCSERCKRTKPSTAPGSLDSKIEAALKALLLGQDVPTIGEDGAEITTVSRPKPKPKKGDPRVIVQLSEVETAVFGDRKDPQKVSLFAEQVFLTSLRISAGIWTAEESCSTWRTDEGVAERRHGRPEATWIRGRKPRRLEL